MVLRRLSHDLMTFWEDFLEDKGGGKIAPRSHRECSGTTQMRNFIHLLSEISQEQEQCLCVQ